MHDDLACSRGIELQVKGQYFFDDRRVVSPGVANAEDTFDCLYFWKKCHFPGDLESSCCVAISGYMQVSSVTKRFGALSPPPLRQDILRSLSVEYKRKRGSGRDLFNHRGSHAICTGVILIPFRGLSGESERTKNDKNSD